MPHLEEVAFSEGGKVVYYGRKTVKELEDNLAARMVQLLSKNPNGLNGAQLAKELGVTPPTVSKTAKRLLRLGIIRWASLPVSQNVKLYSLTVRVLNEKDFEEIRRNASPTLLAVMTQYLAGNEKMALFYVQELQDYLSSLPEGERGKVVSKILEEVTGHEAKD